MAEAVTLNGNLTVREVPEVFRRLAGDLPTRLDLSSVERADSSALALLLECLARARAAGREMEIVNPPENLRVIARLTEVAGLLGWNGDASAREPSQ